MRRRPSILLVFADQMRGSAMGGAGNDVVRTPTMDRLARDGVLVPNSFATVPVCTPNRATLLSGLYPTGHRLVANDLPLPVSVQTIGEVGNRAGYKTGYVGKWHLDGVPRSRFTPPGRRRHEFGYWASYNCSHAYFSTRYYRDSADVIEADGYEPVVQTDLALDFLDDLDDQDPFMLVVSWGPPHSPYDQVPEEFRNLYVPEDLPLPENIVTNTSNPLAAGVEPRRAIADYYAAITALDGQLDRLAGRLEKLGRTNDTVVVFTSDHGDMLWSHGLLRKQSPYDESVQVPLILRWPEGLPSGQVRNQLTGTVDLAPTLLGLVGLDAPGEMAGRDLSRTLRWDGTGAESVLLSSPTSFSEAARQNIPEWRAVRTERHTYVESLGRHPWLLFDNASDPWQMTNLIQDGGYRGVRAALSDRLGEWLRSTGDPFLGTEEMIDYVGMREAWDTCQRGFEETGPTPEEIDVGES